MEHAPTPNTHEAAPDFERLRNELAGYRDELAREGESKNPGHAGRSRTLGRLFSAGLGLAILAAGCAKKEEAGATSPSSNLGVKSSEARQDVGTVQGGKEARAEALRSYHERLAEGSSVTRAETFARAYELAIAKYPNAAGGSISCESRGGVPVKVSIDGEAVPLSRSDYTPEELSMAAAARDAARALGLGTGNATGSESDAGGKGETKTSPDAKDFF